MSDNGFQIFVTDRPGQRRRWLPAERITGCEFSYRADGGMSEGKIDTSFGLRDLAEIRPTDRVEAWNHGVLLWRGYVDDRAGAETDPTKLAFILRGAWVHALEIVAEQRYLRPGGVDPALLFSDILRRWVKPRYPLVVVDAQTIGTVIDSVDAWGKKVADVVGNLREWTGEGAVWGSDVVTDPGSPNVGRDRLYLRPYASTTAPTHKHFVPGIRTASVGYELRASTVVNALRIRGGMPKWPNLFPSDMETPDEADASDGNLLPDPGFEDRSWSTYGGASFKVGGLSEGPAIGEDMLETDNPGEGASKEINPVGAVIAGRSMLIGCRVKREHGGTYSDGFFRVEWLDADGDEIDNDALAVAPPSVDWDDVGNTSRTVTAPAGAAGFRFRVECNTGSLLWDECFVVDVSSLRIAGMEARAFGSAVVETHNWCLENDGYDGGYGGHGGYVHYFRFTAADADGNDIHIAPQAKARFAVLPNQVLDFSVPVRVPAGGPSSPKLILHTLYTDLNGNVVDEKKQNVAAGSIGTSWETMFQQTTAPSNAAYATCWVTLRGSGELVFDAFCVRDAAAGGLYIPVGPLTMRLRAADMTELTTEQRASETVYGWREDVLESDAITTEAFAEEMALAVFRAKCLPPPRVPLEILDPDRLYLPGETMELVGDDGPDVAGEVLAIEDGTLRLGDDGVPVLALSLGAPRPDPVRQLMKEIRKSAGGGGSGGGTVGGGGGGVPGFGGAADAVAAHEAAADPHPQYATDTQFQEVVDARTRDATANYGTNVFASLKTHLASLWGIVDALMFKRTADPDGATAGHVLTADGAGGVAFQAPSGGGGGASLSDATPQALGTAAAGNSTEASRANHVHAMPTLEQARSAGNTLTGHVAGISLSLAGANYSPVRFVGDGVGCALTAASRSAYVNVGCYVSDIDGQIVVRDNPLDEYATLWDFRTGPAGGLYLFRGTAPANGGVVVWTVNGLRLIDDATGAWRGPVQGSSYKSSDGSNGATITADDWVIKDGLVIGKGTIGGVTLTTAIEGLILEWVSATQIRVKSGAAYVQSASGMVTLAADSTQTPARAASTWYYVYLTSAGAVEISTTAPATPYRGSARSKASDTSRRFLGTYRTDASSNIINFQREGDRVYYRQTYWSTPFRVLSAGTATTATTVSCANIVPPSSKLALVFIQNLGPTGVFFANSEATGTGSSANGLRYCSGGNGVDQQNPFLETTMPLDSSRTFQYWYQYAPSSGGAYVDVIGHEERR